MEKTSNTTFWIMFWIVICAAIFVDCLQALVNLIPFVGIVLAKLISLGAIIGFGFFLFLRGELGWRNVCWLLGFSTIEILPIPLLDLLPGWTAGMVTILLKNRLGSKIPLVGRALAAAK
jgi:hypothetical protein